MAYKPIYDATIETRIVSQRSPTMHWLTIDWEHYPFDDPEHTAGMGGSEEWKRQRIAQLKDWLRLCEQCGTRIVYASNYGGWPRIWKRVIRVGMASNSPYWTPRPIVVVNCVLGTEWYDWLSLTGARTETEKG